MVLRFGCELEIGTDYNGVGKILYILGQRGIEPLDSVYTDSVTLQIRIPAEWETALSKEMVEATCGKVKIEKLNELYYIDKE